MRVLLVEDDRALGEAVRLGLRNAGFAIDWATDGKAGLAAVAAEQFSAVVLDLGLPDVGGLQVLKALRARQVRTPVLILTAREAVDDRIRGLDAGGDDYVVKPVAIGELAARLRALVRRSEGQASGSLRVGDLAIDANTRSVAFRGAAVELAPREYTVLQELALHAGRVLTRAQLESRLYEWDEALESNAIEVHVHHLRRKLAPDLIRTIRGVGYLMPADPTDGG